MVCFLDPLVSVQILGVSSESLLERVLASSRASGMLASEGLPAIWAMLGRGVRVVLSVLPTVRDQGATSGGSDLWSHLFLGSPA